MVAAIVLDNTGLEAADMKTSEEASVVRGRSDCTCGYDIVIRHQVLARTPFSYVLRKMGNVIFC